MADPRELYLEYKALAEQAKQIQEFLEQSAENIEEVGSTIEALEEFSQLEKGRRISAPIANGIFVDATLNDPSTFRMNVGGKIVVAKSVEEAKGMLRQQQEELRQVRERAEKDRAQAVGRLREIETLIEAASEEDEQKAKEAADEGAESGE